MRKDEEEEVEQKKYDGAFKRRAPFERGGDQR
jgi:hypothetical protein